MAACALSYGPVTMAKYHTSLWDAVKFEVLNSTGPDDEMAEEALKTVSAIAKALTSGLNIIPPKTTPASRYLATIVKECNELLREPQQKQSKPAGQILASVTIAGTIAHAYVIKNTLPKLLDGYSDADSISKQRAFMEVFNQLFAATSTVYGEWGEIERFPDLENPLQDFKDKLFEIYSQALMGANKEEIGFRLVSLKGLGRLSKIRRLFADNEMGMVVQYLDEVVLEREANASEEIRYSCLLYFVVILYWI